MATQTDTRLLVGPALLGLGQSAMREEPPTAEGLATNVEGLEALKEVPRADPGPPPPELAQDADQGSPPPEVTQRAEPGPQPLMALVVTRPREEVKAPPHRKRAGCWNCGVSHRYADCPAPRQRPFCYGSGSAGTTLADCPRCGPRYLLEGPYPGCHGPRDRGRHPLEGDPHDQRQQGDPRSSKTRIARAPFRSFRKLYRPSYR